MDTPDLFCSGTCVSALMCVDSRGKRLAIVIMPIMLSAEGVVDYFSTLVAHSKKSELGEFVESVQEPNLGIQPPRIVSVIVKFGLSHS